MRLGAASKFLAMLCVCGMHTQASAQLMPRSIFPIGRKPRRRAWTWRRATARPMPCPE
jgi:hypothetical protein